MLRRTLLHALIGALLAISAFGQSQTHAWSSENAQLTKSEFLEIYFNLGFTVMKSRLSTPSTSFPSIQAILKNPRLSSSSKHTMMVAIRLTNPGFAKRSERPLTAL